MLGAGRDTEAAGFTGLRMGRVGCASAMHTALYPAQKRQGAKILIGDPPHLENLAGASGNAIGLTLAPVAVHPGAIGSGFRVAFRDGILFWRRHGPRLQGVTAQQDT